jgi:hypothetical protein
MNSLSQAGQISFYVLQQQASASVLVLALRAGSVPPGSSSFATLNINVLNLAPASESSRHCLRQFPVLQLWDECHPES